MKKKILNKSLISLITATLLFSGCQSDNKDIEDPKVMQELVDENSELPNIGENSELPNIDETSSSNESPLKKDLFNDYEQKLTDCFASGVDNCLPLIQKIENVEMKLDLQENNQDKMAFEEFMTPDEIIWQEEEILGQEMNQIIDKDIALNQKEIEEYIKSLEVPIQEDTTHQVSEGQVSDDTYNQEMKNAN